MQLDLDYTHTLNANRAVDKFAAVMVGKTASEPREFLTKNPATVSLKPVHNLSNTVGRVVLKKEVDLIRQHFHGMHRETVLSSLSFKIPFSRLSAPLISTER